MGHSTAFNANFPINNNGFIKSRNAKVLKTMRRHLPAAAEAYRNNLPSESPHRNDPYLMRDFGKPFAFMAAALDKESTSVSTGGFGETLSRVFAQSEIRHIVDIGTTTGMRLFILRKILGPENDIKLTGVDLFSYRGEDSPAARDVVSMLMDRNIHLLRGDASVLSQVLAGEKADIIYSCGLRTFRDHDTFDFESDWDAMLQKNDAHEIARQLGINHTIAREMTGSLTSNPHAFAMQLGQQDTVMLDPRRLGRDTELISVGRKTSGLRERLTRSNLPPWLVQTLSQSSTGFVWKRI